MIQTSRFLLAAVLACAALPRVTAEAAPLQQAAGARAKPSYTLQVSRDAGVEISLVADGARLSDVAADLAARLGVDIVVGPALRDETLTLSFSEAGFEAALNNLAPHAYVDYEVRDGVPPVPQRVFLYGFDEGESTVRGASHGVMIEGHTEDTGGPMREDRLRVLYENNRLTIVSKRQPLALVVRAIGDTLNVPAEINDEAAELVDADARNTFPEDGILRLSPHIRVHVRVNLATSERMIKRIVVVPGA